MNFRILQIFIVVYNLFTFVFSNTFCFCLFFCSFLQLSHATASPRTFTAFLGTLIRMYGTDILTVIANLLQQTFLIAMFIARFYKVVAHHSVGLFPKYHWLEELFDYQGALRDLYGSLLVYL